MRGLYVSNLDGQIALGYDAKILGQIKGLIANGLSFELISFSDTREVILRTEFACLNDFNQSSVLLKDASSNLLIRRKRLLDAALERLKATSMDILYIRYPRSDPLYLFFLYRVKIKYPSIRIFCEFPTFPYDKEVTAESSVKSLIVKALDRLTRNSLKHFIDRAVAVNYQGFIFGIPGLSINNGITVANLPVRKNDLSLMPKNIHLLGVANVQPWHGYDRIITGLGKYYKTSDDFPKIIFHVVGARESTLRDLQKIVVQHKVEDFVVFYPPTRGEELDKLFDLSDLCVSTLAAHRIDLYELSPLKTREYCARGMPFLLGYKDPDFPKTFEYSLECPADDTSIDMNSVIAFCQTIYSSPDSTEKIHQYAELNLDWSVKMADVAKAMCLD